MITSKTRYDHPGHEGVPTVKPTGDELLAFVAERADDKSHRQLARLAVEESKSKARAEHDERERELADFATQALAAAAAARAEASEEDS